MRVTTPSHRSHPLPECRGGFGGFLADAIDLTLQIAGVGARVGLGCSTEQFNSQLSSGIEPARRHFGGVAVRGGFASERGCLLLHVRHEAIGAERHARALGQRGLGPGDLGAGLVLKGLQLVNRRRGRVPVNRAERGGECGDKRVRLGGLGVDQRDQPLDDESSVTIAAASLASR